MKSDRGSMLPLAIGLSSLAVSLTLILGESASLQVTHSRTNDDARFAALAIARDQGDIPPVREFDYGPSIASLLRDAKTITVVSHDGRTYEAVVCESWSSPFGLHPNQLVCATARVRRVPA